MIHDDQFMWREVFFELGHFNDVCVQRERPFGLWSMPRGEMDVDDRQSLHTRESKDRNQKFRLIMKLTREFCKIRAIQLS